MLVVNRPSLAVGHPHLGMAQHHPIQKNLELLETGLSWPSHSELLDWSQDLIVPKTCLDESVSSRMKVVQKIEYVVHGTMSTV